MKVRLLKAVAVTVFLIAGVFTAHGRVALCAPAQSKEQAQENTPGQVAKNPGEKSFLTEIAELKKKNAELEKSLLDIKSYSSELETKSKELYLKVEDLQEQLKNSTGMGKAVESLNRQRQILKDANLQLKDELKNEKADHELVKCELYEQLGTAYTKAELYSLAIEAYNKSLAINPRNAQVHYNLGLLYRHSKDNSSKAIKHLKKYLQLSPDASNRKDVEYIIKMLSQ